MERHLWRRKEKQKKTGKRKPEQNNIPITDTQKLRLQTLTTAETAPRENQNVKNATTANNQTLSPEPDTLTSTPNNLTETHNARTYEHTPPETTTAHPAPPSGNNSI